ncbi:MAG: menaquinone biosynthetic enzyme MqnA/MqnD family protein [Thermodesulfobacteriota bacterium]
MTAAAPLRLGRISFVNVLPVHLHLAADPVLFSEHPDPPSALNHRLAAGELDLAAVSSVEYARRSADYVILAGLGLSSQGPVGSVLLLSHQPRAAWVGGEIEAPFESETSVALLKVFLARLWGLDCRVVAEGQGRDPKACLRIGDRAITAARSGQYAHVIDLGQVWHRWTGLPLVYALWVARKQVAEERPVDLARLHAALLRARDKGVADRKGCAAEAARRLGGDAAYYREYFARLRYGLGAEELAGLRRFYEELAAVGELVPAPELAVWEGVRLRV